MSLESLGGPLPPEEAISPRAADRGGPGDTRTSHWAWRHADVLLGTRLSSPPADAALATTRVDRERWRLEAASAGSWPGGWVCLLETGVPKASSQGCQLHGDAWCRRSPEHTAAQSHRTGVHCSCSPQHVLPRPEVRRQGPGSQQPKGPFPIPVGRVGQSPRPAATPLTVGPLAHGGLLPRGAGLSGTPNRAPRLSSTQPPVSKKQRAGPVYSPPCAKVLTYLNL